MKYGCSAYTIYTFSYLFHSKPDVLDMPNRAFFVANQHMRLTGKPAHPALKKLPCKRASFRAHATPAARQLMAHFGGIDQEVLSCMRWN